MSDDENDLVEIKLDSIEYDFVDSKEIIEENNEIKEEKIEIKYEIDTKTTDEEYLNNYQYFFIYFTCFLSFLGMIIGSIIYEINNNTDKKIIIKLFTKKFILYTVIVLETILNGFLKKKYKIKVNYTRKINHIFIWSFPFIIDRLINIDENIISILWNIWFSFFGLTLWMKKTRDLDCTNLLNLSYETIDRPEDRPNTLKWITYQRISIALVLIPFSFLWTKWETSYFIIISLVILTFGDGLAEPIGIRFGKHKYKVKGIGTDKIYTRSLEGSSMVYLVSIIIIIIFNDYFKKIEFIINLILIPLLTTIVEAISPHTLDNPLIFLTSASILSINHKIFI